MVMDICFTFDKKYLQYICIVIASILENNNCPITFHLISNNISEKEKKIANWIEELGAKVAMYKIEDKAFLSCPIKNVDNNRLPRAAYYRIDLPQILPQNVKKVLYLDPDTLVLKDLSELYNINIDDYPFAVVEILNKNFNSGVMLMNLDYFRDHKLSAKLFDYIQHNKHCIEYYDQDAFINLLKGNWCKIHPKFNAGDILLETLSNINNMGLLPVYTDEEIQEARENPVIVHYAGSFHYKLWYKNCIHSKQDLFLYYLSKTPYKNTELKKHYILHLMKGQEKPYSYVKQLVKDKINKAFQVNNFSNYLIRILYQRKETRKWLYTLITYVSYIKKRYIEK